MEEIDPLDAFMESLSSDVRRIAAEGHVDRAQHTTSRNQTTRSDRAVVTRRRRYAKLAVLTAEGYFDDDAMRERNPVLFHSLLGEFLGETLQANGGDYEEARHITADDVREDMRHVGMLLRDAMRTVVQNRSYEAGPASSNIRSQRRPPVHVQPAFMEGERAMFQRPAQVEQEFVEEFDEDDDEEEEEAQKQDSESIQREVTMTGISVSELQAEDSLNAGRERFGVMEGEEQEARNAARALRTHVVTPEYAALGGLQHVPVETDDVTEAETQDEAEDEDVQVRRAELVTAMREQFLDGMDTHFVNYEEIDNDESLDHFEEREREMQDQWFERDE